MATQTAVTTSTEWVPSVSFGDRLRVVRRGKRRTQEEMAALLGVKKVTYGTWEAGASTPSHEDIVKIARLLCLLDRVPIWWTLGADDGPATVASAAPVAQRIEHLTTDHQSDRSSRPRGRDRRRRLSVVPLYLVHEGDAA